MQHFASKYAFFPPCVQQINQGNLRQQERLLSFVSLSPSLRLLGGFLVAQFVRMDLDPSHWPFIKAMAFSASTFLVNETNP
jgi:hypothetical protein